MAFSSCGERGLLYSCSALAPHWVASLCRAQALRCRGFSSWSRGLSSCSSQALEHRLTSCGPRHFFSEACGIFQDQGSNPCLLQWQVDSLPLSHQGSPTTVFLGKSCGTCPFIAIIGQGNNQEPVSESPVHCINSLTFTV